MKEHSVNKLNNFISGWYLDDITLCDKLIHYHNTTSIKAAGQIGGRLDETKKKSIDSILQRDELGFEFVNQLHNVCGEYIKQYPYCNMYAPWMVKEDIIIQQYPPGGGFYVWHCERTNGHSPIIAARHMVFIVYLNDIDDGGETEFFHQNIKIKPEKGLVVLFPADWTFTHRGITSPSQEKYISTGWFSYFEHAPV